MGLYRIREEENTSISRFLIGLNIEIRVIVELLTYSRKDYQREKPYST